MKSPDTQSLKNIDYKKSVKSALEYYKQHNVTCLFVIAGLLIGFSLLRVQSLNESVQNPDIAALTTENENYTPLKLTTISFDEPTVERLKTLASDEDITVDSNLPENRNNPFDDNPGSQLINEQVVQEATE